MFKNPFDGLTRNSLTRANDFSRTFPALSTDAAKSLKRIADEREAVRKLIAEFQSSNAKHFEAAKAALDDWNKIAMPPTVPTVARFDYSYYTPGFLPASAVFPIPQRRESEEPDAAYEFVRGLEQELEQATAEGNRAQKICAPPQGDAFVVRDFRISGRLITACGYESYERHTRAYDLIDVYVVVLPGTPDEEEDTEFIN